MTIIEPETDDLVKGECAECGNVTFETFLILTPRGTLKITGIKCAVCGDETPFTPAPPEDFN